MGTPKQTVLEVIRSMPDDATWEQIRYRMDVVTGVAIGLEDVAAGRVTPHDEVMREMDRWLDSFGPTAPASAGSSSLAGSS